MGIKNLKHLLTHTCGQGVIHHESVEIFLRRERMRDKTLTSRPYILGIDANLFLMRYKRIFDRAEIGILKQIMITLSAGMLPVYVFDGKAPKEKRNKVNQRKSKINSKQEELNELINEYNSGTQSMNDSDANEADTEVSDHEIINSDSVYSEIWGSPDFAQEEMIKRIELLKKQSTHIDPYDLKHVKTLLDMIGIPHYTATQEADDLLSNMYKKGKIDACLSDDTDMLPKGCGNMIQINKDGVTQFILDDILNFYKFTRDEFVDLCILLGPDYDFSYLPKFRQNQELNNCKDNSVFYKSSSIPDAFYHKSSTRALCILEVFNQTRSISAFLKRHSENDPDVMNHIDEYVACRKLFLENNEIIPNLEFKINTVLYYKIEKYFESISIRLIPESERKFKALIKKANRFINLLN